MTSRPDTATSQSQSAELFERAQRVLPGGVSRNTVLRKPYPAYASHGEGCRLTDLDGVTRIDFSNNMASLIHGHAYPPIVEAVTRQLQNGTAYMMATESEDQKGQNEQTREDAEDLRGMAALRFRSGFTWDDGHVLLVMALNAG